jgi:hypothetical protein
VAVGRAAAQAAQAPAVAVGVIPRRLPAVMVVAAVAMR